MFAGFVNELMVKSMKTRPPNTIRTSSILITYFPDPGLLVRRGVAVEKLAHFDFAKTPSRQEDLQAISPSLLDIFYHHFTAERIRIVLRCGMPTGGHKRAVLESRTVVTRQLW
jgi:hypothetical protein